MIFINGMIKTLLNINLVFAIRCQIIVFGMMGIYDLPSLNIVSDTKKLKGEPTNEKKPQTDFPIGCPVDWISPPRIVRMGRRQFPRTGG